MGKQHVSPLQLEFQSLPDAAREIGIPRATLRRHLQKIGATTFVDPLDHRRRLVRRADVVAIQHPRLVGATESVAS